MERPVKLGLLGLGTVGSGVYRILQENHEIICKRAGTEFEIAKILVRDLQKPRGVEIDPRKLPPVLLIFLRIPKYQL